MQKFLILMIVVVIAGFAVSCASEQSATGNPSTIATNTAATGATGATNAAAGGDTAAATAAAPHTAINDDTPAAVKAAFPDAQSFLTQHKDVGGAQATKIEKDAGARVPETDHHSYLAFSASGGTRKQIGAATVVKAGGKDVVVVYENKNGLPYIKEVRASAVPATFLTQFNGKGHDDKLQLGTDIKVNGADAVIAKAITDAVRVDAVTMQALYGAAHTH